MAYTLKNHWSSDEDVGCTNYTYQNIFGLQKQGITFVAGSAYAISRVIVKIYKYSTVSGNVTVSINNVTGDSPPKPGTTEYVSKAIACSSLGTSYAEVIFDFDTPYTLTNGVAYSIIITAPNCVDGTHCVRIEVDNRATTAYGGGRTFASNSVTGLWGSASTSIDLQFETYSGGVTIHSITGAIISASLFTGLFSILSILGITGIIAGICTFAGLFRKVRATGLFPGPRPAGYDPDLVWDPVIKDWVTETVLAQKELTNVIIAVGYDENGLGTIYFGDM